MKTPMWGKGKHTHLGLVMFLFSILLLKVLFLCQIKKHRTS
jgi:hypothetical protein